MQITSINNNPNFEKKKLLGQVVVKTHNKKKPNSLNNKYEKLVERYKKEVPLVYNTFNKYKLIVREELNSLYTNFIKQTDMLRKKGFSFRNIKDV